MKFFVENLKRNFEFLIYSKLEAQGASKETVQKPEKPKNPEGPNGIKGKIRKISGTETGVKAGDNIKGQIGAEEAGNKIRGILGKNERNEQSSKKPRTRDDILGEKLDERIQKSLPEGVTIDSIVKKTLPEGKTEEEHRKFVREQFLNGEIKNLNTPKEITGKDGKKILQTEKQKILDKNPGIKEAFGNIEDTKLQDEILVLYGEKNVEGYADIMKNNKIKTIEEFDKLLKEEIIKRGVEAGKWKIDENGDMVKKTPEEIATAKKNMENIMKDPKAAREMASRMGGNKGISESEARNVQPEKLDLTGDAKTKTLNLIKHFEGFVSKSFWDYKQWTWGYGTKADGAGMTITKERATTQLENRVNTQYNLKTELTKRGMGNVYDKLGDNQIAALTSFIFNLGPGKLKNIKSSLVQFEQGGNPEIVGKAMLAYNKAGGKILKGLVERRTTEADLFIKGGKENTK